MLMLKLFIIALLLSSFSCGSDIKNNDLGFGEEITELEVIKLIDNDSLDFVIKLPDDWNYKLKYKDSDLFMYDIKCSTCNVIPNITIVSYKNVQESLDSIVSENLLLVKGIYTDFKLIKHSELKINEVFAQRIAYAALTFDGVSIGVITYTLKKGEDLYIINCMSENNNGDFENKIDFFDDVCRTFNIRKP